MIQQFHDPARGLVLAGCRGLADPATDPARACVHARLRVGVRACGRVGGQGIRRVAGGVAAEQRQQ